MGFQVDMSPLVSGYGRLGQGLGQIGQGIAIRDKKNEQQEQQNQLRGLMQAAAGGDKQAIEQLYALNPDVAKQFEDRVLGQQSRQQEADDRFKGERAMATAGIVEQMYRAKSDEQRQAIFDAAVDDDRYDIDEEDRGSFNDQQRQKDIITRVHLANNPNAKEYLDRFFGGGSDSLPAEAVAFNDLIKDFTPEQKKIAKQVKAGLKGRAISNAELSAIESGEIDNYGKWKVQQRQAEKFAELTGSSRAKAIDKGVDKIQKISTGIQNIDKAISLLSDGAGVGAIEKWLPSIKGSTVALNNLQNTMALDVIGAVTFGALSQGELDLAKNVALNTKLDTPDLIADLQARKSAQEKLKAYFDEQIQFLDQGGTVAGFLRQKERGSSKRPDQAQAKSKYTIEVVN